MLSVVNADGSTPNGSLIDEIVREGARRMLAAALEAEVDAYIAALADQRDEMGRRLVVRNGYHQPRKVTTAAGAVEVKAPRVNDRRVDEATGERKRFASAILPPWCRKSPKVSEVLPLLYLHGLSSGDFVPALEQFLEHWIHLRTTNPIESTFATVRLRTKVTKGAGSAAAALAMVFKLVESAQARWRAVNAPHLVALVRAGARFERGRLVERPEFTAA
ncbi:transposase [Streptomyces sp. NBC_00191]|uniref:transposase n=1 Tax=Streptomyces sp. NBC_00191 TaxID=2975674 RepID=UPI0032474CBE